MPVRIQRKRTKGWKMPENCVYVGRPTKWGNPFKGEDAVYNYWTWISDMVIRHGTMKPRYEALGIHELRGKNLACWCPLDKECHADVLLSLVESLESKGEGKR